jgi:hypothetical protein
MLKSALAASAMLAMAGIGLAQAQNNGNGQNGNGQNGNGNHGTLAAPEIDPASAISALTLLAGGLAVIRGRRTK